MKTYMARSEGVEKKWFLIDGEGKTVGRVSTKIARILRGKEKPQFTPHADTGDFVVVINADKLKFTGKKWEDKRYYRHTGHPGGIKSISAGDLSGRKPVDILRKAVWGMLPKNRWQKTLITRLKVYTGNEHPHSPQKPETLEV
ncbi:MAG TPA: 50S ribosomal protein L13 [Thermodesulfobacteriota bacterium]|nr:50S ribosomal protein L13 [Thermodesulfobacteriota bacterium]